MPQILSVALVSLLFGGVLASGAMSWPVRPGFVGLAAMLASAWMARRYWQGLRADHGPGSPERALWHGLASYSLLSGHLLVVLWQLGPAMQMHSLAGHALAIDNWTLVLGAVLSYWIARDPEPRQDERDVLIAASGLRVGYNTMLVLLLALILALGFGANTAIALFNQPLLAQILILFLILQCLARTGAQLWRYRRDARAELDGIS